MLLLMILAILIIACALLSLSMQRHFKQLLPKRTYQPNIGRALKCLGYLALFLAAYLITDNKGMGAGLSLFFGLFSLAALVVAISIPYLTKK